MQEFFYFRKSGLQGLPRTTWTIPKDIEYAGTTHKYFV